MLLTLLRPPAGFGRPASPRSQSQQQSMVRQYEVGFAAEGYRTARQGENELFDPKRALEKILGFE